MNPTAGRAGFWATRLAGLSLAGGTGRSKLRVPTKYMTCRCYAILVLPGWSPLVCHVLTSTLALGTWRQLTPGQPGGELRMVMDSAPTLGCCRKNTVNGSRNTAVFYCGIYLDLVYLVLGRYLAKGLGLSTSDDVYLQSTAQLLQVLCFISLLRYPSTFKLPSAP